MESGVDKTSPIQASLSRRRRSALGLKRLVDIVGATAGLILTAPLSLTVAVIIATFDGFPIFFRQIRPGLRDQPFRIVKFRTMRAPIEGEVWFRTDETRLTRVGGLLRRFSLDELPEFWNVIKGDMSLVGPRPLLMEYIPKMSPEERRRTEMRPGITGWAQVNGRQTITFSERLRLDLWYIDNWSLRLDTRIILQTFVSVLSLSGSYSERKLDEVDDLGLSADRSRSTDLETSIED